MTEIPSTHPRPINNRIRATFFALMLCAVIEFLYVKEKNHAVEIKFAANAAQLKCQQQHDEIGSTAVRSVAIPSQKLREEVAIVGRKDQLIIEAEETCCVNCTFPNNECCLLCSDVSSNGVR